MYEFVDIGSSRDKTEQRIKKKIKKSYTCIERHLRCKNRNLKKKWTRDRKNITVHSTNKKYIRNAMNRAKRYKKTSNTCLLLSIRYCLTVETISSVLQLKTKNLRKKIADVERPLVLDTRCKSIWLMNQIEPIIYKLAQKKNLWGTKQKNKK